MPINGIIQNIENPIIVFTILFDYYFVKQNYFDYTKNLSCFVRDLYKRLLIVSITSAKDKAGNRFDKFSCKFLNEKKYLKALELHDLSLKCTFNMCSSEELRRFLQKNILDELYIPSQDSLHEVLGVGVKDQVKGFYDNLKVLVEKADKKFLLHNFPQFPFSIAIGNYGSDTLRVLSKFSNNEITPLELIKEISTLDFDNV